MSAGTQYQDAGTAGPRPAVEQQIDFEWGWLTWLCTSRIAVSIAFMMYAGALPQLIQAWAMSAAQAGFIQTAFNVSYAVSLVATGWLSDKLGAQRVSVIEGR